MKSKDLVFLLGSVFIVTIAWISFSIYHNSVTSTIPETLNLQISPISPDFNIKILEKIKIREKVSPVYQTIILEEKVSTSTPQMSLEPVSSDSGSITTGGAP